MQLTGGITMSKSHWRILDLLAILLVASTTIGIIAISIGEWWPFDSLLLPEWPFLAFFAWSLAASTALVLFAVHLQWGSSAPASSSSEEPVTAPQPSLATVDLALSGIGRSRLGLDRSEAAVEVELPESEDVEAEPALIAAGR